MTRKLILALVGLVVLGATSGPAASASPHLTEGGTALTAGAGLSATNVGNVVRTTPFGDFTCTGSTLQMKVIANTGTTIEAEIESATFTGPESEERCSGLGAESVTAENLPWCLKAGGTLAADTFEIRGGKCSEAAKPLKWATRNPFGECTFNAPKMMGTFTTGGTQAHLTIFKQEATRGFGMTCISAFRWDVTYSLETTASPFAPVTIS
jgi:hypothetical protein